MDKHKIGNTYTFEGETFILAQTNHGKVCLISLETGNRWNDPVSVIDVSDLTTTKWEEVTGGNNFEMT